MKILGIGTSLKELIDLYYEIRNVPHKDNPFLYWYAYTEREIVDMFCRWYRRDLNDARDQAVSLFIDEFGSCPTVQYYTYNNGFNITVGWATIQKTYNIKQTEAMQVLEEKYGRKHELR